MSLRMGAVVLNCRDIERQRAFWSEALALRPGPVTEEGRFQVLAGDHVHLSLQVTDEHLDALPDSAGTRIHLDLYTDDQAGEVDRLTRLGAAIERHNQVPGDDYVVMRDPEGNAFCVCAVDA